MDTTKDTYKESSNYIYLEVLIYYFIILLSLFIIKWLLLDKTNILLQAITILPFLVIGWAQFSISNAFHEALHFNFGKKHNEFLAKFMTAYPIGFNMNYRKEHFAHHKNFGDSTKDPDFPFYSNFPKSKLELLKRFAWNLCGIPAVIQYLQQKNFREYSKNNKDHSYEFFATHLLIMSIFILIFYSNSLLFGALSYFIFWIGPLITVAKFCSSTRLLCEHGSPKNELVFRTIKGNFFQTATLGAFNFNYHAEHHIKSYIPYTKLQIASNHLQLKDHLKDIKYEEFNGGYIRLIIYWFKILPL